MPSVELSDQGWQQVLAILATAPWKDANPLLMEIGRQLQAQQQPLPQQRTHPDVKAVLDGNGKEVRHE